MFLYLNYFYFRYKYLFCNLTKKKHNNYLMTLVNSSQKIGDFLFRYRGQFPILLFLLCIPFIYFFDDLYSDSDIIVWNIFSFSCILIGLFIRFYTVGTTPKGTSGRNRDNQVADTLNTKGIYSAVRNPLYLGNFFIWIGVSIFTYNIYFILFTICFFWIFYKFIIFSEEQFLFKKFGSIYLEWHKKTPSFIPLFNKYTRSDIEFSFKSLLRREYPGLLSISIGLTYVDFLRLSIEYHSMKISFDMLLFFFITLFLSIVLKFLKRYTDILKEENRS